MDCMLTVLIARSPDTQRWELGGRSKERDLQIGTEFFQIGYLTEQAKLERTWFVIAYR